MPSVDTLLEIADVYGVNASDIVREVEEARRAARKAQASAVAASTPPVESLFGALIDNRFTRAMTASPRYRRTTSRLSQRHLRCLHQPGYPPTH